MPHLIVRDTDGKDILTREIGEQEYVAYYRAWVDAELVTFDTTRYTLHSVARTRPERNLILCVSVHSQIEVDCGC